MPHYITNDTIRSLLESTNYQKAKEAADYLCKSGAADAESWCMLAMANGHMGLYAEAEKTANIATQLAPKYIYAYLLRGIALMHLSRMIDAKNCFAKILKIDARNASAEKYIGRCWHNLKHLDKAIFHYNHAHTALPDDQELLYYLCDALERNHNLDKCKALLASSRQQSNSHSGLELIYARVCRSEENLVEARKCLETVLRRNNLESDLEAVILNELAHLQDRLGDYDAAFQSFSQSQLQNDTAVKGNMDRGFYFRRMENLKKVISKDMVAGWSFEPAREDITPVFLVGFPRSGTTLIERVLSTHSRIVTSDEQDTVNAVIREISNITSQDIPYPENLDRLTTKEIKRLRALYWKKVNSVIKISKNSHYYLDKLPLNLIDLAFINKIFPDAPIIFVLRDPRDSCLSCFMQLFGYNEAMIHFSNMTSTAKFYSAVMDLWSHYESVLEMRYFQYRYEDLVDDFENIVRSLIEFLELEWEDELLTYYKKKNVKFSSTPSYRDIAKPIYSRAKGRWRNYEKYIPEALEILKPYIRRFGYD